MWGMKLWKTWGILTLIIYWCKNLGYCFLWPMKRELFVITLHHMDSDPCESPSVHVQYTKITYFCPKMRCIITPFTNMWLAHVNLKVHCYFHSLCFTIYTEILVDLYSVRWGEISSRAFYGQHAILLKYMGLYMKNVVFAELIWEISVYG